MASVKDHSDSERGNPLLPHGLLFLISSKGSFYIGCFIGSQGGKCISIVTCIVNIIIIIIIIIII